MSRPFDRYQLIAVALAILMAVGLSAFQDGTFLNALVFGKCEALRVGPPACDPQPFSPPFLGGV
jgi:hypothetical protein